jgi:hypothetical protein
MTMNDNPFTQIETTMRRATTTTPDFLAYCERRFPKLKGNEPYRDLFAWLCFGTRHDQNTGLLLLPSGMLRRMLGRRHNDSRCRTGGFLENFQRDVLPTFAWFEWHTGQQRTVMQSGFDAEMLARIEQERRASPNEPRVYFRTGKVYNERNRAAVREKALDDYMQDEVRYFRLNPSQELVYHTLQPSAMTGLAIRAHLKDNADAIEEAIVRMQPKLDDVMSIEDKRRKQRDLLACIEEDPRIFYAPTSLGRTPRLHGINACALGLCSDVRKALSKGWLEADLVSSQFVIFANMLSCKKAQDVIKSKVPLWNYLNWELNKVDAAPDKKTKEALKIAIYRICFGSGIPKLKEVLGGYADAVIGLPMIQEMLEMRASYFSWVKLGGGVIDLWGTRHQLEKAGKVENIYGFQEYAKKRWEGSLLATQIQSIEFEIMSGLFEWVRDHGRGYDVVPRLFLHDGVTLSCDMSKTEKICNGLQSAIRTKADSVGKKLKIDLTAMRLEIKPL